VAAQIRYRSVAACVDTSSALTLAGKTGIEVIEFGGGNSCFFQDVVDSLPIAK
jgi:hypothetical protein